MKKDEILNASRKEHRNKDLAEMEVVYQAGTGCHRVGQTADAAQETGDQHASVAHLVDIDAHRVRCLGMLAAGAQAQAKAGLVHDDIGHDKQDDGDGSSQIEILEDQVVPETEGPPPGRGRKFRG